MASRQAYTAWHVFVREMLPRIIADHSIRSNERITTIGNMWKKLSPQEKEHWKAVGVVREADEDSALAAGVPLSEMRHALRGKYAVGFRRELSQQPVNRPMEGIVADLAGLQEVEHAEGQPKLLASKECVVCMDSARSVIFLPCKHLACCAKCAQTLPKKECPICKAEILGSLDLSEVHIC